jgi:non-structural maintenance of chromosomes element 4
MARLREPSSSADDADQPDQLFSPPARRVTSESSIRPSPVPSVSSDKENRHASKRQPQADKRKAGAVAMSERSESSGAAVSRKRKLQEARSQPSQARFRRELEERVDKDFYDPDQDEDERRAVRKGMRELNKELNG